MTKTPTPASHAVNTAPDHQPAEQLDALMLAMHLRQRARLTATGNIDALSQSAATVLAAQHEHIRHLEAQLSAIGAGGVEPLRKVFAAHASQHAATVWVDDDGVNDFELTPWFNMPAGEYKLYTQAAALQAAPPAPAGVAVPTAERQRMTAGRASFFMERFLKEEKLLGPNEQAALHFVIEMLAAAPAQAVAVPELHMDRVLSIADVHAEESREDGVRLLDRGGLVAFAKDVLRVAGATPAQEHATQLAGQGQEQWRPMETAPKDGTLLRLLVEFEDHATEDGEGPQPTIGANTWDNHHDFDEWQFAGWNWEQDCYTQGVGKPVGWLPMIAAAPIQAQEDARDAARWRQVLRHVGGQRHTGCQTFGLVTLKPVSGNIMQGSVAEHFTKAIDAARAAQGGA